MPAKEASLIWPYHKYLWGKNSRGSYHTFGFFLFHPNLFEVHMVKDKEATLEAVRQYIWYTAEHLLINPPHEYNTTTENQRSHCPHCGKDI